MKMCENAAPTPESLAAVESGILRDVMADGLRRFQEALQAMADAEPAVGSDGRRLRRARRIGMEIDTSFGKARISVVCGQCKSSRGWETPFRDRLFRGERGAVSPALERKIVTTVCETGSFEKAATVCGDIEGSSLVENVTVSGTVNGSFNVGGFSSWAQDNITMISCTNLANVSSLTSKLGGFHPYFTGTLICSNCCNKGDMTFIKTYSGSKNNDGTAAVGGLLGYQAGGKATFLDCVNEGSINATYAAGVVGIVTLGGFVGRAQAKTGEIAITNGVNSGSIATDVSNTNEQAEVGGFIGRMVKGVSLSMDNVTVAAGTQLSATVKEGVTPYVRAFVGRNHSTTQTAILTLGIAPSEYAPGIASGIAGGYDSTSTADGLTTYFIEATFSVDWDTDPCASLIWGATAPTAEELAKIESWATTNGIADPSGKLGLESYLLGCTSVLTVDPVLHIDAIEQTATGWAITVSASAGESAVPLSSAINGTLKVRYASTLDGTGTWTDATYEPTFTNGTATVTVTAEGAKFMKAVITR